MGCHAMHHLVRCLNHKHSFPPPPGSNESCKIHMRTPHEKRHRSSYGWATPPGSGWDAHEKSFLRAGRAGQGTHPSSAVLYCSRATHQRLDCVIFMSVRRDRRANEIVLNSEFSRRAVKSDLCIMFMVEIIACLLLSYTTSMPGHQVIFSYFFKRLSPIQAEIRRCRWDCGGCRPWCWGGRRVREGCRGGWGGERMTAASPPRCSKRRCCTARIEPLQATHSATGP